MDYRKYAEQFTESISAIHATRSLDSISRNLKGETKLLANLYCNNGKMQAKELAHMAGISTARVTAILNVEEEKGYIKREMVAGDRRKVNVTLTELGRKECQKRHRELLTLLTSYFEFLGEADSEQLLRIMERTKEFMEIKGKENQGKC